jgi:hypothetical protein
MRTVEEVKTRLEAESSAGQDIAYKMERLNLGMLQLGKLEGCVSVAVVLHQFWVLHQTLFRSLVSWNRTPVLQLHVNQVGYTRRGLSW